MSEADKLKAEVSVTDIDSVQEWIETVTRVLLRIQRRKDNERGNPRPIMHDYEREALIEALREIQEDDIDG